MMDSYDIPKNTSVGTKSQFETTFDANCQEAATKNAHISSVVEQVCNVIFSSALESMRVEQEKIAYKQAKIDALQNKIDDYRNRIKAIGENALSMQSQELAKLNAMDSDIRKAFEQAKETKKFHFRTSLGFDASTRCPLDHLKEIFPAIHFLLTHLVAQLTKQGWKPTLLFVRAKDEYDDETTWYDDDNSNRVFVTLLCDFA